MYTTIMILLAVFVGFLLLRRLALSYVSRVLQRKLFEQEYFTILQSPQFKVKGKYD